MILKILIYFYIIKNLITFKFNKNIIFGKKLRVRGPLNLKIKRGCKLIIGNNLSIVSGLNINPLGRNIESMIRCDDIAVITIGDNVGMSCISIWSKKSIFIGDNVKLGANVIIMDSDMHSLNYLERRHFSSDSINAKSKKIIINDDVFVGTGSIITKGVEIGERSIIAAGSVVVKNVPCDQIWGGNPAKFLKYL